METVLPNQSELDRRLRMSPSRPETIKESPEEGKGMNILRDSTNNEQTQRPPRRKKKKRPSESRELTFNDLYRCTGEVLGEGAQTAVCTYTKLSNGKDYAVKIIDKSIGRSRSKVFKEVEIFNQCQSHENILNLEEFFEEENRFYLIFEKMDGGTLLEAIERRGHLTEQEASMVIRQIASALDFLHKKGISHRDLKPENILCQKRDELIPIKICDFDLGSGIIKSSHETTPCTTPELLTPVGSAEFMAPEVVDVWVDEASRYDKKCDIWSLGIIVYIMLCGYPPFVGYCKGNCGWDNGEYCEACQKMLFTSIQEGHYSFPEPEWTDISDGAKDLVRHLLVRDPHTRYNASQVLLHPWVTNNGNKTLLPTPGALKRNNSTKDIEAFAENAVAVNRMILQHLSISEPVAIPNPPRFCLGGGSTGDDDELSDYFKEMSSSDDSKNDEDSPPPFGLSPPGMSRLAQRRSMNRHNSGSYEDISGQSYDDSTFHPFNQTGSPNTIVKSITQS
ncbi:unnamed protein product [Owenia fusiformis]|uniref:non-specific serine/threonine protein kinase n=1 Tax=Owenia fusiformis TaxID=6347 RepID=A0A8S4N272_OWEFU|nr:unnamed protein product [Owenia fusiformis]